MEIPKGYSPKPPEEMPVSYWAIFGDKLDYVVNKVKLPLQKAIEQANSLSDIAKIVISTARKIPRIKKGNTSFTNSHILIDKEDLFDKYYNNPKRKKLLKSFFKVMRFEYEHDGHYAFIGDWLLIELAMEMARGNWIPRFTKEPLESGSPKSYKDIWLGPDLPDVETLRKRLREALDE